MSKIYFKSLPDELKNGTAELLPELGLTLDKSGVAVAVEEGKCLSLSRRGDEVKLTYARKNDYFRALSRLPSLLAGGEEISEQGVMTTLCLMADMSRGSVMTLDATKRMMRYMAMMGYDSLMLYTEETYEIESEPYFGYTRGRYSLSEMKEIDDYGFALGIEVIPCIQTLGHLLRLLQWDVYKPVKDTDGILLVGEEKTYELIDKMLATMAAAFRSRRINIGMDEAHTLGRGKYMDKNGYRVTHEIMLEHLERVIALCKKHGFKTPMMWSDMFFRMAFDGQYYVEEGEIPPEVAAKIPKDVTLIYWDYYKRSEKAYDNMCAAHTKIEGVPCAFAGGAWCWNGFAPANRFSCFYTDKQLKAAFKYGISDVIVTAWGDNGADCSRFATLPAMLFYAEYSYTGGTPSAEALDLRSRECFGMGFEEMMTLDAPKEMPDIDYTASSPRNPCKNLFYNDPLQGRVDLHLDTEKTPAAFAEAEKRLLAFATNEKFGYMFDTLARLCRFLAAKCDMSVRMRAAYRAGDKESLAAVVAEIPHMVDLLDEFYRAFKAQWFRESKPFGFEVHEIRIGGLRLRLLSTKERVEAYLNGSVAEIPELMEEILPISEYREGFAVYSGLNSWQKIVSSSAI